MKEFKLTTKTGETITKTSAQDIDSAIQYFAKVKQLRVTDLIKIYNVKEC
jgi:hypothetical protein